MVNIATYTITLGVVVMIMAMAILRGFQSEIEQKAVGFGSHIIVRNYEVGHAYESKPINITRSDLQKLTDINGVAHMQHFAYKGGMIKTEDQIHGIILKGVDRKFDSTFFATNLIEGRLFDLSDTTPSNEVIISKTIANKLNLQVGDKMRTYFWQEDNYRARALQVVGIYCTDLTDFDEHYLVGDIRQIQRLNGWDSTQAEGCEILVDNFDNLGNIAHEVASHLGYDLEITTIIDQNPTLFAWLNLLNSNIALILVIMALVCAVAVISAFLIMIFEKTSMIGVLKTLGATNQSIRHIFLIKSTRLIAKGILLGNAIALLLCWLQHQFRIVKLDSASYSMDFVPIDFNLWIFLFIGLGTLIVSLLALLLPASYISRLHPAQTIKIES